MAVIRLTLLVAVLGGLTLLLVQNWSPVLPIVFLGMRTQPIPLAIWILFSTAAGAFTSLLITILFKFSNFLATQSLKTVANPRFKPRTNKTRTEEPIPQPNPPPKTKTPTSTDEEDDWETNRSNDDWDFDEQEQASSPTSNSDTDGTYERQQQPKAGSKSGSSYSYSYREPKNTGVGKTESVYDADYRVIIPPYQPPTQKQDDDDDWGIFNEDDDFERK
jgi:hypothetical protein